jgi:hypothetical protein
LAGYGLNPAHTMTWRRFWYAWLHNFLKEARSQQETQTFQMWIASLPGGHNQSQRVLSSLRAGNNQSDKKLLESLQRHLPLSVLPLLGLTDMAANVSREARLAQYWEEKLSEFPRGSQQRIFLEASRDEVLERTRKRRPN